MKYIIEMDSIIRDDWELYAQKFTDYTIYQTWPYQQVRSEMDKQELSRFVIKNVIGQEVLMGQVRIKHVKLLGLKIGYIQWGPLILNKNGKIRCSNEALKLLCDVYLGSKVNILRLVPNIEADETGKTVSDMLIGSGFKKIKYLSPYHTMMFPLDISEEEMLARLKSRWRRDLRKAEKKTVKIIEGTNEEYMKILKQVYQDAQKRKQFQGPDIQVFAQTQKLLLSHQKMNFVIAYVDDEPVTVDLTSYLGDTAVGLFQASTELGRNYYASYLVWWRALLAAKKSNMKRYDLGGIDPENNPNVYQFKKRMGADECNYIGVFEAASSMMVRNIWHAAEKLYRIVKKN